MLHAGGPIDSCSVTLCFYGADLDPDAVTRALGAEPTSACRKGDIAHLKHSGDRVEERGKWILRIEHQREVPLEAVINGLLDRLTDDLASWRGLTGRFRSELSCGLQMELWNRGLELSPGTLGRIAERGLPLGFDIYFVGRD